MRYFKVMHFTFQVNEAGTHWYHSHVGSQRTNGAFGAFIVREMPKKNVTAPKEFIMTVGDWHHLDSDEVNIRHLK